jgi:hypothetical protein
MFYTRSLLLDEAASLRKEYFTSLSSQHTVWRELLRDIHCEQLMLFIGIGVGLLTLLPKLEADRFGATNGLTHPPLPSRLLLTLHVAGLLVQYCPKYWENRSAAITATLILVNAFQKEEFGSAPLQPQSEATHAPPVDDPSAAVDFAKSKWQRA